MNAPRPLVGTRMRRLEDPELVQGAAEYVGDLKLPGMLSVSFVRCPLGRGRVRALSLDRARNMPGVVAAFGPHDLAVLEKPMRPMNQDPQIEERTPRPLTDEARCAGDAVAVVVADDPYRAADAAGAVEVTYDELPTVIDPAEATKEGAPLVHPDVPGNVAGHLSLAGTNGTPGFRA